MELRTIFLSIFLTLFSIFISNAQEMPSEEDLYDMSLEDLMNIEIYSVSKEKESLFEAPLASYTITREEIIKSGVVNIPEALRLCPGVIVRELTTGVYDVHIRGFDNPLQYTIHPYQLSVLTLVMIDNRPVFNQNNGGTSWENLPIDIHDVERIELVQGPNNALYGPNAVTGVINIITSKLEKKGVSANAGVQAGVPNTIIANSMVGYSLENGLDIMLSGHYNRRERHTEDYYSFATNEPVSDLSGLLDFPPYGSDFINPLTGDYIPFHANAVPLSATTDINNAYPETALAYERFGLNLFSDYQINDEISLTLDAGLNQAEAQRVFFNNTATPLSFNDISSRYVNLSGNVHGVNARFGYLGGNENVFLTRPGLEYDMNVYDLLIEYDLRIAEWMTIRPGFNYQRAIYDDSEFTIEQNLPGILNGERTFINYAGSLRGELTPFKNLRLVGAIRVDHYNNPDDLYISTQAAATYNFNNKFLVRAFAGRSNSGSYMGNTYSEYRVPVIVSDTLNYSIFYQGNRDLDLQQSVLYEVGFRYRPLKNLSFDLAIYNQRLFNLFYFINQPVDFQVDPNIGIPVFTSTRSLQNVDTELIMNGLTLSANWAMDGFQFKPFITIQQSMLYDFHRYYYEPGAHPDPSVSIANTEDKEHESTPNVFGGFFLNYSPYKQLNFSVNSYFSGSYIQYHEQDNLPIRENVGEIDSRFLLNATINYNPVNWLTVSVTGRNLFNQENREFYGADPIGSSYLLGLRLRY